MSLFTTELELSQKWLFVLEARLKHFWDLGTSFVVRHMYLSTDDLPDDSIHIQKVSQPQKIGSVGINYLTGFKYCVQCRCIGMATVYIRYHLATFCACTDQHHPSDRLC